MQRETIRSIWVSLVLVSWSTRILAEEGPDPVFEKPVPISMAELAKRTTTGVSAVEVNDYAPGHYTGAMTPSPPHADGNAKKAIIVFWSQLGQLGSALK